MAEPTLTPEPGDPFERAQGRRREDELVADVARGLVGLARWGKHIKAITLFAAGTVAGVASLSAWVGAQHSSPGRRIERLEVKVDSGFSAINADLNTVHNEQAMGSIQRQEMEEKVDVLLRLGCRRIQQADLLKACRDIGATK